MQSTRFGAILTLELWSPGVSVASTSQYLLVFYYKLFYESTLNNKYIS